MFVKAILAALTLFALNVNACEEETLPSVAELLACKDC